MQRNSGFTLLELTIAVAIFSIVSLLSFLAIRSGAETSTVAAAKEEVSSALRDTLMAVSQEVRQAYTARTVASAPRHAPANAAAVTVINSGKGITYYVPTKGATVQPTATGPITIEIENEDANGNSKLDGGEDKNGDGVLTRRLVRRQGATVTPLGASNTISNVVFSLSEDASNFSSAMNQLTIRLTGDLMVTRGAEEFRVASSVESQISMEN